MRTDKIIPLALATCLIVATAAPALAEQGPQLHPSITGTIDYQTTSCIWSPPIKESAGVYYQCPSNTVLAGEKHSGDENGSTEYLCCSLIPQPVKQVDCSWSGAIRESDSNYTCPGWQVLAGRYHSGDENGSTKYYCCDLDNPVGEMWTDSTTCRWSDPQRQSNSDLHCDDNGVMTGRSHQGDENGDTEIFCCNVAGQG